MRFIRVYGMLFYLLLFFCISLESFSMPIRDRVLQEADRLLEHGNISYVYGGRMVGHEGHCDSCTQCLDTKKPGPKERLSMCPICQFCSLDCSHFIALVYQRAGLKAPYLTTKQMLRKSTLELKKDYHWVDLGRDARRVLPGDILVYPGHVVMVESLSRQGVGQIIHSTSGKELKGAGQGIQRQSQVSFSEFKGSLLRILRHKVLLKEWHDVKAVKSKPRTEL